MNAIRSNLIRIKNLESIDLRQLVSYVKQVTEESPPLTHLAPLINRFVACESFNQNELDQVSSKIARVKRGSRTNDWTEESKYRPPHSTKT